MITFGALILSIIFCNFCLHKRKEEKRLLLNPEDQLQIEEKEEPEPERSCLSRLCC